MAKCRSNSARSTTRTRRIWRRLGAKHVIVHRSRDAEAAGKLTWGADDIARIRELHDMGFTVTITGGVKTQDIAFFKRVRQ